MDPSGTNSTPQSAPNVYLARPLVVLLIPLVMLLCFVTVGPLVVPVPPLEGTLPPTELAGEDSQFIDIQGVQVHYTTRGQGDPTFLLLHGFGASTFSWREVFTPLAESGRVIAYDRPAFGLTERPLPGDWSGVNPYSPQAQPAFAIELLEQFGVEQAVWIGNSAGGTVALQAALEQPERVQALVLVDAAVYRSGGAPGFIRPLLGLPWFERIGPWLVRGFEKQGMDLLEMAWSDTDRITDEIKTGYRLPLQADNWDVGLWEVTKAAGGLDLAPRLGELNMPVLVISGADDQIVPADESIRLAREIPGAELVVLEGCGHVPHEECPGEFLAAVNAFLAKLE